MSSKHPAHTHEEQDQQHYTIRLRRRSAREWFGLLIWVILLLVLLEYALTSVDEHEPQAAILAGGLFICLLAAGIITQIMRGVEAQSHYNKDHENRAGYLIDDEGTDEQGADYERSRRQ